MDFQLNTLIAWPKPRVKEEGHEAEGTTLQPGRLEDFRLERVLYVDAANNEVWAIDVHDSKAWPQPYSLNDLTVKITLDQARIIVGHEPYPVISLPDEELGPDFAKHIAYRDAARQLIEPLLKIEIKKVLTKRKRIALIAQIASKTGRDKSKVRFQLRRFWQRGCTINALFPDWHKRGLKGTELPGDKKRGRPTIEKDENGNSVGVNVTPEDEEIFKKGIKQYVVSGVCSTLPDAWQRIKETFYITDSFTTKQTEEGTLLIPELLPADELPTLEQFIYYYRKWRNPSEEIIVVHGQDEYERNIRPVLDSVYEEAPYPGALYQIDAAIGDAFLVNDFDRTRLIGRPVIYIIIDTFSRRIVGWSVTLEGPSWVGARLALEMAFINIGYCEALIADNGEIKGYNANSLVNPLQIRVVNAPAYRPDWKPIVERNILTIKGQYIDFIPGRVIPWRRVRGRNYRLESRVALNGFRRLFGKCVDHYNSSYRFKDYPLTSDMVQRRVKPIPNNLWEYGVECISGLPRAVESVEKLKLCLLPKGHASVHQREGIYFRGLYYVCKTGLEEGWFDKKKGARTRSFAIAFEQTVDRIFLCLDHGRRFEECVLTNPYRRRFAGKDWSDVRDYFAWKNIVDKNAVTETQQSNAEFHADIENLLAQEVSATEAALAAAGLSDTERLRDIRRIREQLKAYERKFGPVPNVTPLLPPSPLITTAVSEDSEHKPSDTVAMPDAYVAPATPTNEILAAKQKGRHKNGRSNI
jgi:putative transposase